MPDLHQAIRRPSNTTSAYFDSWYRRRGIGGARRLARKVALAVATAEYHLERPIRTVLDIGCGEGAWRAPLLQAAAGRALPRLRQQRVRDRALRPRRNLHTRASATSRSCGPARRWTCWSAATCCITWPARELDRGLPGLAELCGGVAFLETFAREDGIEGDEDGFQARPRASNRRAVRGGWGFTALGSHLLAVAGAWKRDTAALETPGLRRTANWRCVTVR